MAKQLYDTIKLGFFLISKVWIQKAQLIELTIGVLSI